MGVRNFVVDSLSYPERNELAVKLVDTATMAPGIDETSNRESGTATQYNIIIVALNVKVPKI